MHIISCLTSPTDPETTANKFRLKKMWAEFQMFRAKWQPWHISRQEISEVNPRRPQAHPWEIFAAHH
jgi:hypothetical protein